MLVNWIYQNHMKIDDAIVWNITLQMFRRLEVVSLKNDATSDRGDIFPISDLKLFRFASDVSIRYF